MFILEKDNLEKENFKLRIENRNLKKSSELLQEEVKFLKEAAHNIDLLSDHDRTIGENIDLKKTKELQAKEIKQLIEDNRKIQKQLMEIKESHEGVTQVNISLEKKMKKEKQTIENNFLQKIQKILEENNKLEEKLKKTENLLKDAHQELKKTNLKSEDDFKALFQSHMEFTSKMEIFGKNYRKNSNG